MVPTRCVRLTRPLWQMIPRSIGVSSRKFPRINQERLCALRNGRNAFSPSVRSVTTTANIFAPPGGCQGNDGGIPRQADDGCGGNRFAPACIAPQLVAHYEEIVDLPNHPETLLIDVREPTELAATGQIPTSINIPLKTVRDELALSADGFAAKYGRKKPAADDPIIFSCRSGVRAGQAALVADQLGFRNVKNYVGSWQEYGPKHGLPVN